LWIRRISLNLVPHSKDLFDTFITDIVARRGLVGFFGFIAFIFASSTTFGSVRLVLNRVFGGREDRGLVRGKFMQIVMMFGTSLLFFIIIAVVYAINVLHALLENLWFEKYLHSEIMFVIWIAGVAATFALFLCLYRFAPAATPSRSGLLVASGTAHFYFKFQNGLSGSISNTPERRPRYTALSARWFSSSFGCTTPARFLFLLQKSDGCLITGKRCKKPRP
jgi:uncharacterized BrkB/YihY/UPF0761 family membrane protein